MPILVLILNHDDHNTSITADELNGSPKSGDELGCGCDRDAFAGHEHGLCGDNMQRDHGTDARDPAFALCRSGDSGAG